jgi:NADPH:quinone reductase-like Zn-dependent oxidoreductase
VGAGAIKLKIARVFPFDEAAAAHHFIQDRKNIGKVVLTP